MSNCLVELGPELVFVANFDPQAGTTQCPPWFRQQQGSPKNDAYPANSVAVINPLWPYHHIAQNICNGIANLYPSLFQVKTTVLQTLTLTERYVLPADVDEIVKIRIEDDSFPQRPEREVGRWSLDTKGPNGDRYLYMPEVYRAEMPIYITYRAAPTIPDIASTADYSATGLTPSSVDLPVLWAVAQMLPAADAAKPMVNGST